jgi:hypothetical protein
MNIGREERIAIISVVNFYIEDERTHCEEELSTMFDDHDFEGMSDKDLYNFCVEKGFAHIWTSLYSLKHIK